MQPENVEAILDDPPDGVRTGPRVTADRVLNGWHRQVNEPIENPSLLSGTVRIGIYNEGKLSMGKLHALSHHVKCTQDICILSEGAFFQSGLPPLSKGTTFIAPRKQRWGGVGILGKDELLQGRKAKLHSNDKKWSISVLSITKDCVIIGAYITPTAATDETTLTSMLTRIETELLKYKTAFIGGDWNSRSGTASRAIIDGWAVTCGLQSLTENTPTHFPTIGHRGHDLDVAFVKGTRGHMVSLSKPSIGHARLVFDIELPKVHKLARRKHIAWNKLRTHLNEFNDETYRLISQGVDPPQAFRLAGETVLGTKETRSNPLPSSEELNNIRSASILSTTSSKDIVIKRGNASWMSFVAFP
jgi:hypothetical protein